MERSDAGSFTVNYLPGRKPSTMPPKTSQLWNRLRSLIKECLTFSQIKDAAGRAGLPLERLSHLQQRQLPAPSASKSELLDAISDLLSELNEAHCREAITAFIQQCLRKCPDREGEVQRDVTRCGFSMNELHDLEEDSDQEFRSRTAHDEVSASAHTRQEATVKRPAVFVSYSHADIQFKEQLVKHLKGLSLEGKVTYWSDENIKPGEHWFAEITNALEAATVAVLLVSGNFLASDFIRKNELNPVLLRHENGTIKLLWVPVRACNWEDTKLQAIQAVVSPTKPLAEMKAERDRAWVKICKAIKATAGE